jgi:glycosyltransferase involved in cell wall biosynthesis
VAEPAAGPRVVHVVPALFDRERGVIGGAERYAFELARHMARRVPTTLVAFGDAASETAAGALRVRVLGPAHYVRGQRANPITLSLVGALRRSDVIHAHQQHVVASSAAALVGRLRGRPVFVTDLGGGGWDLSAYVSTDRWYAGHLHISEYSRHIAGHDGDPRARVILGGVDTERFSPDPSLARDGSVAFVGRLLPHKGVDVLLRALPGGMRADVIGPAPDARYLADLHGLAEGQRVRFRHDADDAELVKAYRSALCVVLPSVYRTMYGDETRVPELLGQTLLEAMACGTPVIGTAVASVPEVVDHGVTGFVVPPGDAAALGEKLRWLDTHREEARAMGLAARRRVEARFTWDGVVERCLAAYAGARGPA